MDAIYLEDVTDFANYELALEGVLSFHGVSQIMEQDFGPPELPQNDLDLAAQSRFERLRDEYQKKEEKAAGIILNSLKKVPHIRDRVLAKTPRVNGIRPGSTLYLNLKAEILLRHDTASLKIIEQKLEGLYLASESENDLNILLGCLNKYYSILEAHQAISDQAKILKLQKACSKFPKLDSFLAIVSFLPNTNFESVCVKLRAHILASAVCLHQEAQKSERVTADLTNVSDSSHAKVNMLSRHSPARHYSSGMRSTSPYRNHKRQYSPNRASGRGDPSSEDSMDDSDRDRSLSPHRSHTSSHRSRHSYRSGRSSSDRNRARSPTVSFKSTRAATPPPAAGILKTDAVDQLAHPNLKCFRCKGYGHKVDVCPSVTK